MGVPSKDTIKICDDSGFVSSTPERKYVYNIQTPQTFRTEIIADAYKVAFEKEIFGTDDASSVSYTHLDVYKRQEDRLLEWFTAEENIMMTAVNLSLIHISHRECEVDQHHWR